MPRSDGSGADDLTAAAAEVHRLLEPHVEGDWTAVVPEVGWTVAQTVVHMVAGTLWYAVDLSAGGDDLASIRIEVDPDASPRQLLAALDGGASMLARVISSTPPDARGYHPMGEADASGFAAMGCDELLVHGWDAARGLGTDLRPDPDLARRTLERLFPWVDPTPDPWQDLLWANGRTSQPNRPRQTNWQWHCKPLNECEGQPPS